MHYVPNHGTWPSGKSGRVKGKGKGHPRTVHGGPEEGKRYSSILSLTSALDGGGWSTPTPGRFTPGKQTRYPLYRKLSGPQGRSGRVRKNSPPPGFEPPTFQPVENALSRPPKAGWYQGTVPYLQNSWREGLRKATAAVPGNSVKNQKPAYINNKNGSPQHRNILKKTARETRWGS